MSTAGNILFCGVGGQGILLASEVTSRALMAGDFDVKKSEVHGMAQRGGSVVAHLRYGERVFSPLIEHGTADVVLSFELMEAARYLPFMHPGTTVIVNTQKIAPPAVATGKAAYPADPPALIREHGITVIPVDGAGIAAEAGEPRAANIALVGVLSTFLPVAEETFVGILRQRLPRKVEENLAAFRRGRELGMQQQQGDQGT